ncbi:hypothetical protein SAY87_000114 [Trapa incisa]|uniref:Uncharacterized protein n=2 Tax=Trapa TaxID=22665 RepID=A0AAN7RCM1_TRANT|nr:hypothetical protein SAY87_000114 [Trapa incisa]KAK4800374.1 hypothetical protein SAY86_020861 [Trapa natans]
MGNYISCTLSTKAASGNLRSAARVIFPTGEIRQFFTPENAAELMLEAPNHFLANTESLRVGRRFSALAADEELEMGKVYVLVHMERLGCKVSASDLGPVFLVTMAASSKKKRRTKSSSSAAAGGPGSGRVRVSPGYSNEDVVPEEGSHGRSPETPARLSFEGIEEYSTPEFKHRISMSRSKKPQLETIVEDQAYSRPVK